MPTADRDLSPLDRLLSVMEQGLRTLAPDVQSAAARPRPQAGGPAGQKHPEDLTDPQARRHAAALMRVNHAGEISAQALYQGQALVADNKVTRDHLLAAAREETDHLAWCAERLQELDSRPSLLNPLWYGGSLAIGALTGLMGDRISLGFVAETERQVEGHLDDHLARLPSDDVASRVILEQMKEDEVRHGAEARAAGGTDLPPVVRSLMRAVSRVMTRTAYWV